MQSRSLRQKFDHTRNLGEHLKYAVLRVASVLKFHSLFEGSHTFQTVTMLY